MNFIMLKADDGTLLESRRCLSDFYAKDQNLKGCKGRTYVCPPVPM
jgi:hypothetical protein